MPQQQRLSVSINRQSFAIVVLIGLAGASAAAQDQPPAEPIQDRQFLFSVSTPPAETRHATVHLDSGVGERAFDLTDSDRPEQRFGIQAAIGNRLTFLGRIGLSSDERDLRSSQQGELLYNLVQSPRSHGSLAVGFGMRHESAGTNVLLGRVAAGRSFSAWRVDGNALFEKPYSIGRDAVDLITTFGVSRRLFRAFHAGVELIGEDLEGFWEEEEAEGGARVLVGPSLRVAPRGGRWQVSVAGGPVIHATRSGRSSEAARGLPSSSGNSGYAVRAALGYGF
jgi:hypothetical protein